MKALQVFILIGIHLTVYSQNIELTGRVTARMEEKGRAGIYIQLIERDSAVVGTFTKQNGDFEIINIRPGIYDLRIQAIGAEEKVVQNLEISSDKINDIYVIYPDPCLKLESKDCPNGHSDKIIPIIYGLAGKKLLKKAARGKISLGGCIVTECDPQWFCRIHEIRF